jgi:hypothetical protein
MIPYEELVAALQSWRSRQGLATDTIDYLGGSGAADYSIMDTAVAAEAIEEISDYDVADEVEVEAEGYGAEPAYGYDDQAGGAGDAVEYQQADIEAMRAEYAFDEEQETAYSPVQSDAEVEEQALDYGDYDDDGSATVIGDAGAGEAPEPGAHGYGMDAPVAGDDLDVGSFAPVEHEPGAESADDDLPTGYDQGSLDADPAAGEDLPGYEAASVYGDSSTVDVDLELGADDVIESALPPPPPTGGFDDEDDQATAIAAPAEPPPLAPPPEEETSASVEIDSLDVIDEDDDPNRAH